MVKFRIHDTEVDPCFCCRICGVRPYVSDSSERTQHPGFATPRPLWWLNARLDDACLDAIEVIYRSQPLAGQTLAIIKDIEKSEQNRAEFLEKKQHLMLAMLAAQRNVPGNSKRGQVVEQEESVSVHVTKGAFTFYPEKLYQHGDPATNGLGHTTCKLMGTKGVAVYDLPPGVVLASAARRRGHVFRY